MRGMERRWRDEINAARAGLRGCRLLYAAIRDHGSEAWTHEVLDVVETRKEASAAEVHWIGHLGTLAPGGYNLNRGGRIPSDETREILSKAVRAHRANLPEGVLSARSKKMWASRPQEVRDRVSAKQRAAHAAHPRGESIRKGWAAVPPERRSEIRRDAYKVRRERYGDLVSFDRAMLLSLIRSNEWVSVCDIADDPRIPRRQKTQRASVLRNINLALPKLERHGLVERRATINRYKKLRYEFRPTWAGKIAGATVACTSILT